MRGGFLLAPYSGGRLEFGIICWVLVAKSKYLLAEAYPKRFLRLVLAQQFPTIRVTVMLGI